MFGQINISQQFCTVYHNWGIVHLDWCVWKWGTAKSTGDGESWFWYAATYVQMFFSTRAHLGRGQNMGYGAWSYIPVVPHKAVAEISKIGNL